MTYEAASLKDTQLTPEKTLQKQMPSLSNEGLVTFSKTLHANGFSGFLLPKTDAHRSEYCPNRDNLVQFLTGFAGSTGCVGLVLNDPAQAKGAIFVDGRYTLQAHDEVDTSQFSIVNYTMKDVVSWFAGSLESGDKVAFDPQLLSLKEHKAYGDLLSQQGIEFVSLADNSSYGLWESRPEADAYPLSLHSIQYSGVNFSDKLTVIRDQMKTLSAAKNTSIDGFFLNYAESIAWLFNVRAHDRLMTPVAPLYRPIPPRFWNQSSM